MKQTVYLSIETIHEISNLITGASMILEDFQNSIQNLDQKKEQNSEVMVKKALLKLIRVSEILKKNI